MSDQEKEKPKQPDLASVFAQLMGAQANPDVLRKAVGLTNMAYAFQFAQTCVPCVRTFVGRPPELEIVLRNIHAAGGLLISCATDPSLNTHMIVYYGKE